MYLISQEKEAEIEEGMNRLSLLSEVPSHARNSSFTHAKVIKLWADVLRSNFTEEEKESLKVILVRGFMCASKTGYVIVCARMLSIRD